jgi:hypothetical protein
VSDILSFCLQLQIKGKASGSSRRGIERDNGTVPASISPLSLLVLNQLKRKQHALTLLDCCAVAFWQLLIDHARCRTFPSIGSNPRLT